MTIGQRVTAKLGGIYPGYSRVFGAPGTCEFEGTPYSPWKPRGWGKLSSPKSPSLVIVSYLFAARSKSGSDRRKPWQLSTSHSVEADRWLLDRLTALVCIKPFMVEVCVVYVGEKYNSGKGFLEFFF